MPPLNSFLHHGSSRQPGGLVVLQAVQELPSNHLHSLSETLLTRTRVHLVKNGVRAEKSFLMTDSTFTGVSIEN